MMGRDWTVRADEGDDFVKLLNRDGKIIAIFGRGADAYRAAASDDLFRALALAKSMILGGEKMTDQASEIIDGALQRAAGRDSL